MQGAQWATDIYNHLTDNLLISRDIHLNGIFKYSNRAITSL